MNNVILIMIGIFGIIAFLTLVFLLARYKKADPSELLVVFGNTKKSAKVTIEVVDEAATEAKRSEARLQFLKEHEGEEDFEGEFDDATVPAVMKEMEVPLPAKMIHGGGTVVLPFVQGWHKLSMKPLQFEAEIDGLDSQSIQTQVVVVVSTAISQIKSIQQNAAVRFLGMQRGEIETFIKRISLGEIRGVMTKMPIEKINADRNTFLLKVRESLEGELKKVGFELTNINISEISDKANYIKNIGLNAATKAQKNAEADIAARVKDGNIKIANTKKEEAIAIAVAKKDEEITVAQNKQAQDVGVAEAEKDKMVKLAETQKDREAGVAEQKALEVEAVANANANAETKKAEAMARQITATAAAQAEGESNRAKYKAEQIKSVATSEADAAATQNEQENKKQVRIAQAEQLRAAETTKAIQEKEAKQSEYESDKRQRAAEAGRKAGVAEQRAKIDVAKARADAGKADADADKVTKTAAVEAEMFVEQTRQERQKQVNMAQADATEALLNATEIIPAQKAKEKIVIDAEAEKEKIILGAQAIKEKLLEEARGEAEATKMKLEAQAEGEKKLLLAQAEGKEASLMAEAHAAQQTALADAMQFEKMMTAAGKNPDLAVHYKFMDKIDSVTGNMTQALTMLKDANITVYGDTNTAAQLVSSIMGSIVPGLDMMTKGLKGHVSGLFSSENGTEIPAPKTEKSDEKA